MHDDDHGHSPAAWIGVAVMLVAVTLGCYGVAFGPLSLMWIGLAGFAVGALAWYLLARAGLGSQAHEVGATQV